MQPFVLSIAGFDPSGGAGVLADCKTFEQFSCHGLSVVTAITHQNEKEVHGVSWVSEDEIRAQLCPLLDCYSVAAVKVGIVPSASALRLISEVVRGYGLTAPIIWDPVRQATAGRVFFEGDVAQIPFKEIDLVTPNCDELLWLTQSENKDTALFELQKKVPVYVKNFRGAAEYIVNTVAFGGRCADFEVPKVKGSHKHGSGCVLSAAIAAGVATGMSLREAIAVAEEYVARFLKSDEGLLGFHAPQELPV